MSLGILIEDEVSRSNWQLAEADMRRFWSHRCKVHRYPDKIFIEVGSPVRVRVKMGVERLQSFCVKSRPAISWSLLGKSPNPPRKADVETGNPPAPTEELKELVREFGFVIQKSDETSAGWRDISTAPSKDGWISQCLFGIQREWGWETWVGQCDDGTIWLGCAGDGSCFDCDKPTHWMPLPPAPREK